MPINPKMAKSHRFGPSMQRRANRSIVGMTTQSTLWLISNPPCCTQSGSNCDPRCQQSDPWSRQPSPNKSDGENSACGDEG